MSFRADGLKRSRRPLSLWGCSCTLRRVGKLLGKIRDGCGRHCGRAPSDEEAIRTYDDDAIHRIITALGHENAPTVAGVISASPHAPFARGRGRRNTPALLLRQSQSGLDDTSSFPGSLRLRGTSRTSPRQSSGVVFEVVLGTRAAEVVASPPNRTGASGNTRRQSSEHLVVLARSNLKPVLLHPVRPCLGPPVAEPDGATPSNMGGPQ